MSPFFRANPETVSLGSYKGKYRTTTSGVFTLPNIPEFKSTSYQERPIQSVLDSGLKNGDFVILPSETEDFQLARVIGKKTATGTRLKVQLLERDDADGMLFSVSEESEVSEDDVLAVIS